MRPISDKTDQATAWIRSRFASVVALLLISAGVITITTCEAPDTVQEEQAVTTTPLDMYVDTTDSSFEYEMVHESEGDGHTFYVLRVVSQEWLSEDLVEDPSWWHWVSVAVPEQVEHDTAFIWIGGGSRNSNMPTQAEDMLSSAASLTNSVAVEIHNVPNQPVHFKGDTLDGRYEDALIAYGWHQFMAGGAEDEDAEWLARLPMTRAVTAAMDAVAEFTADRENLNLTNWVVSGASKRGWTTWTTAAVDDRVVAMAPVVIDLLNLEESFKHHWRNYGFWAPAVNDYVDMEIMQWMGSKEFRRLMEVTEPYYYIERYDMPKLLINASGDQFFQPDSWQFYWRDLTGEKYLRYVPNAGHSLDGSDATQTLLAFYHSILKQTDLPDYQWSISESTIQVESPQGAPLQEVKLWSALNEDSRDFRVDALGKVWQDSTISLNESGEYSVNIAAPEDGWKAYFVELTYDYGLPLKLTTGVTVLPEAYPYPPYDPENLKGTRE